MGEKEGRKEPGVLKNFVAGGVGGACIPLILHPLDTAMDTIKVTARSSQINHMIHSQNNLPCYGLINT